MALVGYQEMSRAFQGLSGSFEEYRIVSGAFNGLSDSSYGTPGGLGGALGSPKEFLRGLRNASKSFRGFHGSSSGAQGSFKGSKKFSEGTRRTLERFKGVP